MSKEARRLNFEKCTQCRKDKQKCEPVDRQWPQQKCNRCVLKGWPCSENVRAGSRLVGDAHEVLEADFQQYAQLSLRLSALHMMTWKRLEGHRALADAERAERESILRSADHLIQSTESTVLKFATLSLVESLAFGKARQDGRAKGVGGLSAFVETARQVGHLGAASSISLHLISKKARLPGITRFVDDCGHLDRLISGTDASGGSDLPSEFSISRNSFSVIARNGVNWESLLVAAALVDVTPPFDAFGRTLLHIMMGFLPTITHPVRGPILGGHIGYISIDQDAIARLEQVLRVVDIDKQDFQGCTALHIACSRGQTQAAQFLIEKGAKPHLRDASGETPIDLALTRGELDLVVELCRKAPPERRACFLIHAAQSNGTAPLSAAYNMADFPIIKAMHQIWSTHLLADGSCQDEGLGFLHLAACRGDIFMLRPLIENNLRPFDCRSRSGRTPLSLAAERGYANVVEILLRYAEVDPDARDNSGRTPLSFAAENGHYDVVKVLLLFQPINADIRSVDLERKDDAGHTPSDYATAQSHLHIVDLLLHGNDLLYVHKASWTRPENPSPPKNLTPP